MSHQKEFKLGLFDTGGLIAMGTILSFVRYVVHACGRTIEMQLLLTNAIDRSPAGGPRLLISTIVYRKIRALDVNTGKSLSVVLRPFI